MNSKGRVAPAFLFIFHAGEYIDDPIESENRRNQEDSPIMRFYDVGAIVYYLKATPWQIPDFSVEKYFDKLTEIHNHIEKRGYVDARMHYFLIIDEKL